MNRNNEAVEESINTLHQQTQINQTQMMGLQQIQQRQLSPERNMIGSNMVGSGFPTYDNANPVSHKNPNRQ